MTVKMPDIPSDIFYKFNEVKFNDEIHKYTIGGQELISVTTIIHLFENEFEEDYWSERKADELGLTKKEVLFGWKYINEKATTKGSTVHNYAENLFDNKFFPYPKELINSVFGYDPIREDYLKEKTLVDKFYKDSFNKLIPIKTELVVFDIHFGVGGMVDLLVYNVRAQEFQIWDYKTNKELTKKNKRGYKLKGCLSDLDDCDMEKYSMQLSTYKYIIERNTNIKLGTSYLVWINVANDSYKVIPAIDRTDHVKKMLNEYSMGLLG